MNITSIQARSRNGTLATDKSSNPIKFPTAPTKHDAISVVPVALGDLLQAIGGALLALYKDKAQNLSIFLASSLCDGKSLRW